MQDGEQPPKTTGDMNDETPMGFPEIPDIPEIILPFPPDWETFKKLFKWWPRKIDPQVTMEFHDRHWWTWYMTKAVHGEEYTQKMELWGYTKMQQEQERRIVVQRLKELRDWRLLGILPPPGYVVDSDSDHEEVTLLPGAGDDGDAVPLDELKVGEPLGEPVSGDAVPSDRMEVGEPLPELVSGEPVTGDAVTGDALAGDAIDDQGISRDAGDVVTGDARTLAAVTLATQTVPAIEGKVVLIEAGDQEAEDSGDAPTSNADLEDADVEDAPTSNADDVCSSDIRWQPTHTRDYPYSWEGLRREVDWWTVK